MTTASKQFRTSRRLFGGLVASALFAPAVARAAFPERLITIVVGLPPGSPNDILARMVAERLRQRVNQPVIVENRPGAAGIVATRELVERGPKDGYRLLLGSISLSTALATRRNHPGFDVREDLAPLVMISVSPMAIAIPSALPAQNLQEFIAYARTRPGQMNYASVGGVGGIVHLVSEVFLRSTGLNLVHIPYQGSAVAVPALMNNDVQLYIVDNSSLIGGMQSGRLRVLAVAANTRLHIMPDVPTAAEAGLPFEAGAWYGVMAPAGIPADARAALEEHLSAIVADPSFQEQIRARGSIPGTLKGEGFRQFIREEVVKWQDVARQANIPQE